MDLSGININVTKLVIIIIIVLVVVAIIYGVYKWGQSQKETDTSPVPKQKTGDLTSEEISSLEVIAKNLYRDMDGLNWNGHDEKLFKMVSVMDDRELYGLSNIFNHRYQKSSGQSLKQWIQNENFYWDSSLFTEVETYAELILQRFTDLNIA